MMFACVRACVRGRVQVGKDDLSWGWCTFGGSLWHAGQKELSSRGGSGGGGGGDGETYRVYVIIYFSPR